MSANFSSQPAPGPHPDATGRTFHEYELLLLTSAAISDAQRQHGGHDRAAVVAGRSDGDTARRTLRAPAFFELVVAELVEILDHSCRGEPLLYDDARAGRRCGEFLVDAIDRFPVVNGVDEDLAGEEV